MNVELRYVVMIGGSLLDVGRVFDTSNWNTVKPRTIDTHNEILSPLSGGASKVTKAIRQRHVDGMTSVVM